DGRFRNILFTPCLRFAIEDSFDPTFDLANVVQVAVESQAIRRRQAGLKTDGLFKDRIQDGSVFTFTREALLGRTAVAEQFFEHDLGTVFHWQWNRRCSP